MMIANKNKQESRATGETIGGWLVLLGFTIIVSLVKGILFVKGNLPALFDSKMMESLGLWRWHLRYEVILNSLMIVMCLGPPPPVFFRAGVFPVVMITTLGVMCCGLVIKAIWLRFLPESPPILSLSYLQKVVQFLICCAWIAYLSKSNRPKQTFVRSAAQPILP